MRDATRARARMRANEIATVGFQTYIYLNKSTLTSYLRIVYCYLLHRRMHLSIYTRDLRIPQRVVIVFFFFIFFFFDRSLQSVTEGKGVRGRRGGGERERYRTEYRLE